MVSVAFNKPLKARIERNSCYPRFFHNCSVSVLCTRASHLGHQQKSPNVIKTTSDGSVSTSGLSLSSPLRCPSTSARARVMATVVGAASDRALGPSPRTAIRHGRRGWKRPRPTQLHGRRSCVATARVVGPSAWQLWRPRVQRYISTTVLDFYAKDTNRLAVQY